MVKSNDKWLVIFITKYRFYANVFLFLITSRIHPYSHLNSYVTIIISPDSL